MSALKMRKRQREFTYDIFLSFNGKDTRRNFTDHLHEALTQHGIETFRDDKSLERGEDFPQELLRAIKESWGSIIVISEGYASSHWCLKELVEIMKQKEERGHIIYPIFYHVEPSDFRHQINRVKGAFDKYKERYNEETTQGWRDALKKVTDIHGRALKHQYESDFIKEIVKDVSTKIDSKNLDEQEVKTMKENFRMIDTWMVVAENNQYMKERKEREVLEDWLDKLKDIAYRMIDVLDEWNTVILQSKNKDQAQSPSTSSSSPSDAHNIPSFFHLGGTAAVSQLQNISLRIKKLNEESQVILKQRDDFPFTLVRDVNSGYTDLMLKRPETASRIDESVIYGRDHDKDALIRLLLSDDNCEESDDDNCGESDDDNRGGSGNSIPLLAIVGIGGLGKTTLAQLAYNDGTVRDHFDQRIWVCVSDPFDAVRIAKAIVQALKGDLSNELDSLLQEISQKIVRKKFLLVLDDVWIRDERKCDIREQWEQLNLSLGDGSRESKILVTTRNERVANILGCSEPFWLGVLSSEDSWSLFDKIAFFGKSYQDQDRKNLESIGRDCVKKCEGLPLAIKVLAGVLSYKGTRVEWQRILDSRMWELDEAERGIFSSLLLSYYDLPSPLRQCFSYCAIFPKDHLIKKDLLIKLWMAQGFLRETQGNEMEIIGEGYFDDLATRYFFQEFEKDEDDDSIIIGCKMHDIVHDFAQLLRRNECCLGLLASHSFEGHRAESYHENVRHLTFTIKDIDVGIPNAIYSLKKSRSFRLVNLLYRNMSSWEAALSKLCAQLTCLRMLDLTDSSIRKLPQEIGKLIHLRYLSLENSELFKLPEALCDLYNLQTLNIRMCFDLRKLPRGMGKLINLRHLQNKGAYKLLMPKEMGRLTCLRTLEEIVLRRGRGISLQDLGKLIHLRGQLHISGLGNVRDASEAREARLLTKAGFRELKLIFNGEDDDDDNGECYDVEQQQQRMIENAGSVLEALQPPQHLQNLGIRYYKGPTFPLPNWMMSLTSLKKVELDKCVNWESLPPLGKLPSLESLDIHRMEKVKKVGEEFLGVETSSSSSAVNHNIIAFPNLETLRFDDMKEWEEWEYENVWRSRGGDNCSSSSSSHTIAIMPKLQRLSLGWCPKLKTLPRHLLQSRALQRLRIRGSPIAKRYIKETGDEWPSISHIPSVEISRILW